MVLTAHIDIKSSPDRIYNALCDTDRTRRWFPHISTQRKGKISQQDLVWLSKDEAIEFIAWIEKELPFSLIAGTLEPIQKNGFQKTRFEWKLEKIDDAGSWTRVSLTLPEVKSRKEHHAKLAAIALGGISAYFGSTAEVQFAEAAAQSGNALQFGGSIKAAAAVGAISSIVILAVIGLPSFSAKPIDLPDWLYGSGDQTESFLCESTDPSDFRYFSDSSLGSKEMVTKADSLAASRQYYEAFLLYRTAVAKYPQNSDAWTGIGNIQVMMCGSMSTVAYQQALNAYPENQNPIIGVANFYTKQAVIEYTNKQRPEFMQENAGNALKYYGMVKDKQTNYKVLNGIGTVQVVLGNHDEAIKIFSRSLEIKPDRAESLNGMAFAYFEKGDTQSAIAYYEKSLSIDGSNYDALSGLKNSYQKLQRPDIASSYETALQSLG